MFFPRYVSHKGPGMWTICFTICLFISPDLDGHRAPKMKYCPWTVITVITEQNRSLLRFENRQLKCCEGVDEVCRGEARNSNLGGGPEILRRAKRRPVRHEQRPLEGTSHLHHNSRSPASSSGEERAPTTAIQSRTDHLTEGSPWSCGDQTIRVGPC